MRRVLMRHASKSHPRGGSDALNLENTLAGYLEVRVKLTAHGLCYTNAYELWSLWSSACSSRQENESCLTSRSADMCAYTPTVMRKISP